MNSLLDWYDSHGRDLPWRRTRDPYAIWISEVMAQQTTIASMRPKWEALMAALPTVQDLAGAPEEAVMHLWQGLGYYRRAALLHEAAQRLAKTGFPETEKGLLNIPGIGPYTAAAIASICFREPSAVVDTNVLRVYSRLTGDERIGEPLRVSAKAWGDAHIEPERPGDWNQALMELGALICKKVPLCEQCPLQASCTAFQTGRTDALPRQAPKPVKKDVGLNVLILTRGGAVAIEPSTDWWKGLWQFPIVDGVPLAATYVGASKATVTHHRLSLKVFTQESRDPQLNWHPLDDLDRLPMSTVMRRIAHMFQVWLADTPTLDGLSA